MTSSIRNVLQRMIWLPSLLVLLAPSQALAQASDPGAAANPGYVHYAIGDASKPRPGKVEPGLLLNGGGKWPQEAFRWFVAKAGNGHIVILRASLADELQKEFYHDVGGITSAETFVFSDRRAASDPKVLAAIEKADGIFIAGGDQSRYVRFWKGTPLNVALDRHVREGKPIGGTSAGLAILGAWVYGAMDNGSMTSPIALRDPLGKGMTLVGDFLHMPFLQHVITDTHFSKRQRLGRLLGFLAKLDEQGVTGMVGIGIDESASLCIDGDGIGHVYTRGEEGNGEPGYAWIVQPKGHPQRAEAGKPLAFLDVPITGVGVHSTLHMPGLQVDAPAFHKIANVRDGRLGVRDADQGPKPTMLVIHGGAGLQRAGTSAGDEQQIRAGIEQALRAGHAALAAGKPALDAVTAAITVLEDNPQFNAGKGAVFTHDGRNELDASLMDGTTLEAGAVAGVHHVRNPILLARAVMEHSKHVMLAGDGAEIFAKEQGVALVDPSYFRTEKRWQQLQKALKEDASGQARADEGHADEERAKHFGTVGALALDGDGNLAAGTSTGGMTDKRYGRIGDSPIIGAGTYANAQCAVSSTGWGEFYIRVAAAYEICARMAYLKETPSQAGEAVINDQIPDLGGDGGAIVLGADGQPAFPFNTEGMARGWIGDDGVPHVALYSDETFEMPAAATSR